MQRNEILKRALPVLLLIAAYIWMGNMRATREKSPPIPKDKRIKEVIHLKKELTGLAAQNEKAKSTAATPIFFKWERNPFYLDGEQSKTTISSAPQKEKPLVLKGILWDKQHPKVIINDTSLSVGDKIGAYQVLEIKQHRVRLNNGTDTIELKMGLY